MTKNEQDARRTTHGKGGEPDSRKQRMKDRARYWAVVISELMVIAAVISVLLSTAALIIEPNLAHYARNIIVAVVMFSVAGVIQKRLKENWWWANAE